MPQRRRETSQKISMEQTRYITAGSLIDGSGSDVRKNVFLAVKDGIISGIGPAANLPSTNGAVIDYCSQCIIVPPLVDASVFLSRTPSVDPGVRLAVEEAGIAAKATLAAQHVRYCFSHGVLGVAASDDSIGLAEYLQKVIDPGIPVVIRTSGQPCRRLEDCEAFPSPGTDFLKIIYGEILGDGEAFDTGLSREELCTLLQHKGKAKAVVVANGQQQVKQALAAGCDAIEQGYGMGEENLRLMAQTNVLWIPCVLMAKSSLDGAGSGGEVSCRFSMRYAAPGERDPGAEAFWKGMLTEQLAQLRLARTLGVKTAVGTGAGAVGILHGESMVEEMKLFIKAGWSVEETIRSATENGAAFFGMENLGALAVGRQATFLVARGTVQQLPRKLGFLEEIYVDGSLSPAYRKYTGLAE